MSSTFGPYQLIRKIAQGGMAEVFLASRRGEIGGFSKQVAIKRIYEHLAEDPELITMFFDEGRIAARLNHSNIVQIYDLGQIDGCFYIAMEFVNGCDLRSLCERGLKAGNFLPLPMAVRIIASAATGLHYAHTRLDDHGRALNIVHRDVSPQNILISVGGEVKVCDFGIAKAEARMTQTQTGQFKGKFAYMSPEQVFGEGKVLDRRSDIFSLGILLYEITVCTRLFKGKNDYDTIRMVAEADVTPPTHVRQGFPKDLERIILKALARSPHQRYQTAEEMQLALEEWLLDHRAKTSPVHISRYMQQVFPELASQPAPSQPATWEADLEQPTYQGDVDATRDDRQGVSVAAEYADAGATGEINIQAFRDALEDDQSVQDAYDQAASFTPQALPKTRQRELSPHISAQWSSAPEPAAAPDFSEEGAGATRITQADTSSAAPSAAQQESSGQWQGPESYARSSGHWSSVPNDPASGVQPYAQQQHTYAPEQAYPAAPQHPHVAQASQPHYAPQQQPYDAQPYAQQPAASPQPHGHGPQQSASLHQAGYHHNTPAAQPAPQASPAAVHQESAPQRYAPEAHDHEVSWDVQGTSLSMKHDIAALQKGSQRKKVLYVLAGLIAVSAVAAVIAFVGVDRPSTKLSEGSKPIDEALLEIEPPAPLARASTQIETSPPGARVVINGVIVDGTTPGAFELAEGHPNELVFFLAGRATERVMLAAGETPNAPVELAKAGEFDAADRASIEVISEPLGALVYHNGEQIGPAPVTLSNLDPSQLHHVQVTLADHHAYQAMLNPIAGEREKLRAVLDPMTSQSKQFYVDLSLETLPRGANILINGEPRALSPSLYKADRHQLYRIAYQANNYRSAEHILEAREAGTLMLRPRLEAMTREKGKVSIALPSGVEDVYLGPNQYKPDGLKNLELKEGTYKIVVLKGGERYETTLEVIPKTSTRYKFELLNGSARVRKVD